MHTCIMMTDNTIQLHYGTLVILITFELAYQQQSILPKQNKNLLDCSPTCMGHILKVVASEPCTEYSDMVYETTYISYICTYYCV